MNKIGKVNQGEIPLSRSNEWSCPCKKRKRCWLRCQYVMLRHIGATDLSKTLSAETEFIHRTFHNGIDIKRSTWNACASSLWYTHELSASPMNGQLVRQYRFALCTHRTFSGDSFQRSCQMSMVSHRTVSPTVLTEYSTTCGNPIED